MQNGEFFKAFFEESRSLMQLPPKSDKAEVENVLNNFVTKKTIMKLKNDEELVAHLRFFKFRLITNGFEF